MLISRRYRNMHGVWFFDKNFDQCRLANRYDLIRMRNNYPNVVYQENLKKNVAALALKEEIETAIAMDVNGDLDFIKGELNMVLDTIERYFTNVN